MPELPPPEVLRYMPSSHWKPLELLPFPLRYGKISTGYIATATAARATRGGEPAAGAAVPQAARTRVCPCAGRLALPPRWPRRAGAARAHTRAGPGRLVSCRPASRPPPVSPRGLLLPPSLSHLPSSKSAAGHEAPDPRRRCRPPGDGARRAPRGRRAWGATGAEERARRGKEAEVDDEEAERRRKEEVNRKIASRKALSVILRREATKAVLDKRKPGKGTRRLLPRTVLEALHDRVAALRWDSALKVFELMRDQVWYRPHIGIYIKLITMLGKCKQPEKAHELFQAMIDEGCAPNLESYTALVSAYSRSSRFREAFELLDQMKDTPGCQPDVQTYSILIKSCLHAYDFERVKSLMADMARVGIRPNTVTYNTLIDAYGKAGKFAEMESTLLKMLQNCKPDVWTMNSTLRAFGSSGQIETMENCYEKFQASDFWRVLPALTTTSTHLHLRKIYLYSVC
ncbi:hypothetical protein SETIT_3G377100v2 [Setaria italica]|uniref:Pentacotripeptide-repeat region of PRORP domain-containing protein n=1 Tax=Setaria italica TaxID=4555 RepID=A0A368QNP0_SETIT|nr:hypothetical protein SETIT_3G377100v2 [Setaria italica]